MKPYPKRVTSVQDYIEWTNDLAECRRKNPEGTTRKKPVLYRGQGQAKWPPRPGIGRKKEIDDINEIENNEERALTRFRRQLHAFRDPPRSPLNLTALAQHYKLRTRVLDWTDSPLVALWFAVSGDSKGDNSIIYAIDLPDSAWIRRDRAGELESRLSESRESFWEDFPWDQGIRAYVPDAISQRIVNQRGYLTIQENPVADLTDINLADTHIAVALIDIRYREKIRSALAKFDFHEMRIHPEVEGLAKYIDYDVFDNSTTS